MLPLHRGSSGSVKTVASVERPAEGPMPSASTNSNLASHYIWLKPLVMSIIQERARGLATGADGKPADPLFIIAGACPNSFCPMQAILFSWCGSSVEFWWLKPRSDDPFELETNTLTLHADGAYKNAPASSSALYGPLAKRFTGQVSGKCTFGVDDLGRAFVEEEDATKGGAVARMLVYFIWQEDWSGPFSWRKLIRGKLCYQRGSGFYSRQYEIRDGNEFYIAHRGYEELLTSGPFPPDEAMSSLVEISEWLPA